MSDKIESLLRDWARSRRTSPEQTRRLASRIVHGVSCLTANGDPAQPITLPLKLRYAALAVAAVALAVGAVCLLLVQRPDRPRNLASEASLAALPPHRIQTGRRLFAEMERLFSEDLRWIAESNGDISLGIEPIPGGLLADSRPVLVRLVGVSRQPGEAQWQRVWSTDVLVRGQEIANVPLGCAGESRATLWVYPLSDGRVAVDTAVSLQAPVDLSSTAEAVLTPGKPMEILSCHTAQAEHRLLQTVTLL